MSRAAPTRRGSASKDDPARDLPFRWRGGNLALDFNNTTAWTMDPASGRQDVTRPQYERLTRYSRLVAWAREAGSLTDDEAASLLAEAKRRPAEANGALDLAIILRLAIHRIFQAAAYGEAPDLAEVATLNALTPQAERPARIKLGDEGVAQEWPGEGGPLMRPLWPVIRAATALLASDTLRKVRVCAGDGCGWMFLDRSRAGNRRWCAMEDCGQRAHSHRRRGDVPATETTEQAVAAERRRLSRELHDSVSQVLYSIALSARTARTLLERDPTRAAEPLDFVLTQVDRGLAEMRSLIFDLRPDALEREGLVAALQRQVRGLEARYRIECRLALCHEPEVPLPLKETVYRIAQEALQNTVKHAEAGLVQVSLSCSGEEVILQIEDDGKGFDPAASYPGHLGLDSMRERASQAGGALHIDSIPGLGARVRLAIPYGVGAVSAAS